MIKKRIFLLLSIQVAFSSFAQDTTGALPQDKMTGIQVIQRESKMLTTKNIKDQQVINSPSFSRPDALKATIHLPLPQPLSDAQQRSSITDGPQTACLNITKSYSVSMPTGISMGITSTYWDFGDGSPGVSVPTNGTSSEFITTHIYTTANRYTITVRYMISGNPLYQTSGVVDAISCGLSTVLEMAVNPNIHVLQN